MTISVAVYLSITMDVATAPEAEDLVSVAEPVGPLLTGRNASDASPGRNRSTTADNDLVSKTVSATNKTPTAWQMQ